MDAVTTMTIPGDDILIKKIHFIRNQKVMLDKDLAELYGVIPRRLKEQVKRNIERFPSHFMFQLTESEAIGKVSQNATPSRKQFGGSLPYAFTEHGVLMLANVLKNKTAISVSLRLVELFVRMREMLSAHKEVLLQLTQLEQRMAGHDDDIQMIFSALKQLLAAPVKIRNRIGYRRKDEAD